MFKIIPLPNNPGKLLKEGYSFKPKIPRRVLLISSFNKNNASKDKLQSVCEFNSGKLLFFKEDSGTNTAYDILQEIETKVREIKETNQFIIPGTYYEPEGAFCKMCKLNPQFCQCLS